MVDGKLPLRHAAESFQVSVTTRWAARYREHCDAGMGDRSSRPVSSPQRTATNRRLGHAYLPNAVGDHSRPACCDRPHGSHLQQQQELVTKPRGQSAPGLGK
ncbi:hypothetical protein CQ020_15500 [Arthrobacter sp. MYb23]|uniref:leucine zipper domain-containing protein n=1 Tax=unclassified Arthrobacter TaxID=235627 RepID=UPI000CFE04C1|nr:hypothetical protein CQ038_22165 [Arthrobacter sp. MYb51]PRB94244.1 hypothetical protein CQ020_15500 [Arthrobacter sp. MYb23]